MNIHLSRVDVWYVRVRIEILAPWHDFEPRCTELSALSTTTGASLDRSGFEPRRSLVTHGLRVLSGSYTWPTLAPTVAKAKPLIFVDRPFV